MKIDQLGMSGLRHIDEEEINAVSQVLKRKTLYRGGGLDKAEEVNKGERALSKMTGFEYSLLLNSGTSALQSAMHTVELKPGDEVLVSSAGWITDLSVILEKGAIPVFLPMNLDLESDFSEIEKHISTKTKAILLIHAFGVKSDIRPLESVIEKYDLTLIEDSCQSFDGSFDEFDKNTTDQQIKKIKYHIRKHINVYSFQAFKFITSGEGGATCTNNEEIYLKMLRYHDAGFSRFHIKKNEAQRNINSSCVGIGFNMRMSEVIASILNVQLKKMVSISQALNLEYLKTQNIFKENLKENSIQIVSSKTNHISQFSYFNFLFIESKLVIKFNKIVKKYQLPIISLYEDEWHTLPGWLLFLKRHGFSYKTINSVKTIDNFKKIFSIQVNINQSEEFYHQLKLCLNELKKIV